MKTLRDVLQRGQDFILYKDSEILFTSVSRTSDVMNTVEILVLFVTYHMYYHYQR